MFAEKHAGVLLSEMGRVWSRGPRVKVLRVSSSGRVEYTKAVSLECALPVVGLAEGDGGRRRIRTHGWQWSSRRRVKKSQRCDGDDAVARVGGGGGVEGGGGGKFAPREGGGE